MHLRIIFYSLLPLSFIFQSERKGVEDLDLDNRMSKAHLQNVSRGKLLTVICLKKNKTKVFYQLAMQYS